MWFSLKSQMLLRASGSEHFTRFRECCHNGHQAILKPASPAYQTGHQYSRQMKMPIFAGLHFSNYFVWIQSNTPERMCQKIAFCISIWQEFEMRLSIFPGKAFWKRACHYFFQQCQPNFFQSLYAFLLFKVIITFTFSST